MEAVIQAVTNWIVGTISSSGYTGIVILMGIESACIPLPSEIIMPFGGYLVSTQPERFTVWGMGIAGGIGCVWGSIVAYFAGKYGGRPFIEKYGKYILIRHKDLDHADAWFQKYGYAAVFIGRLLPVIRTFISFPAGIARMNFFWFVVYTFVGSVPWCFALAYIGKLLGDRWDTLRQYFHGADVIIAAVVLILVALYIYHHFKGDRESKAAISS